MRPWIQGSISLSSLESVVERKMGAGADAPSLSCLFCQKLGDKVWEKKKREDLASRIPTAARVNLGLT